MRVIIFLIVNILLSASLFSQKSFDAPMRQKNMSKDLEIFKGIRKEANSGLYKYRTKAQIDSTYQWAEQQIKVSKTYGDFFKIIAALIDFEGSLHNVTEVSGKVFKSLKAETWGYFPYPLRWVDGEMRVNFDNQELPLGTSIHSINGIPMEEILSSQMKYTHSDGYNTTGKYPFINVYFSRYFRFEHGLQKEFKVTYQLPKQDKIHSKTLASIGDKTYFKRYRNRHTLYIDKTRKEKPYKMEMLNDSTALLRSSAFDLGMEGSSGQKAYQTFLDSTLLLLKERNTPHLILDLRGNGGGNPPNDMMTAAAVCNKAVKEVETAWVSFQKMPYWRHFKNFPWYLKPIAKSRLNKRLQEEVPIKKEGRSYYGIPKSYAPHQNVFQGQVYLLIDADVASAASVCASSIASYSNAIIIGEETSGGYYGHNGVFPADYHLPKSKIRTVFSVVNIEQDVVKKDTQPKGRGIIPDHRVVPTLEDFINKEDTELKFTLKLIQGQRN